MEFAHEDIETIAKLIPGPTQLKDTSRGFFLQLIDLCKDALIKTRELKIIVQESRFLNMSEPIPKNDHYNFIPEKIRHSRFMEFAEYKHLHRASVTIKHRIYNFTVVQFVKSSSEILSQEATFLLKQACAWLLVASEFAPRECSNTVNVNLYMTDAMKNLPEQMREYIDDSHVNTAFTTSCAKNTTINLFRKEEWFKVFIHETFHNLGLDFSQYAELNAAANVEILRAFRINSEVRLYETYCEMWAETINVVMRNVSKHMRMIPENVIKHIEHDLRLERAFSLFQTAKLLNHFGIKYADFIRPDSAVRQKYKERTEVFSYFILKSILMYDINRFVEWCVTHNRGSLRFHNPDTNIMKYARELILSQYNRPDFLQAIENVEETMFSPKKRIKNVRFMYSTMRMSVFG